MKPKNLLLVFLGFIMLFACNQEPYEEVKIPKDPDSPIITKSVISGYAQKGPFINGSAVMIFELDKALNQTGRVYSTNITNNIGTFEKKNVELVSNYVELKAEGYYFNEVTGQTSGGQIRLYALADVSEGNTANVNVLTHLKRPRVNYLVSEGKDFTDAKQQAQSEVLELFGFEPTESSSEALSLLNDAKLLAISAILQSWQSTGDMMELMAKISEDIKEDGKLDNIDLGTQLMDGAYSIARSLSSVRDNLKSKYSELDDEVEIPDFEKYVESFLESGLYPMSIFIKYPATGIYGVNILSDDITSVAANYWDINLNHSMRAEVPDGFSLKIVLRGGYWAFVTAPLPVINWNISMYNEVEKSQVLTVNESGTFSDLAFKLASGFYDEETREYYIIIEYYENGSQTPTKTKKLYLDYGEGGGEK